MSIHSVGRMGQGAVPGLPIEGYLFANWPHGVFLAPSTTPSAQLTGTGNGTFTYNLTPGVVIVDGTALSVTGLVDAALETPADILDDGQTKFYAFIAWKNPVGGAVAIKIVEGTIAIHANAVGPTDAEIEATLPVDTVWIHLGTQAIARTGATSCTEAQDHLPRPTGYAT